MMTLDGHQLTTDEAQIGMQLSSFASDIQCPNPTASTLSDLSSKNVRSELIGSTETSAHQPSPPGSRYSDLDTEAELGEDSDLDMTEDKDGPPHARLFDRNLPSYYIPSFEELHNKDQIKLKDPEPGRLRFPGHMGHNGRQIAWKDLVRGTQQRILPPQHEPLWKQMQSYCQLWGTWIATVENEQRRVELMDWVTLRMRQAWETGIKLGHCGDPTGHTTCCSSHGPQNNSFGEGASSSQPRQVKEVKRKPADLNKQPAPFMYDGQRISHSIINRELETVGISMDTISQQIAIGLEAGEDLLADMTRRLGGRAIQLPDWTHMKYLIRFDPRSHQRNLFMYCLWEVQRCRNLVNMLEGLKLRPHTSIHQQKVFQKRIDCHRNRAEQHLALAIVLDDRSSADDNDEEDEDEGQIESDRQVRKSSQITASTPVIEIASDDDDNNSDVEMGESTGERSTSPESASYDHQHDHDEADQADEEIDQVDQNSSDLFTSEAEPTKGLKRSPTVDDDQHITEEPASKKLKLESQGVDENEQDEKTLNFDPQIQHSSPSPNHAAQTPSRTPFQQLPDVKYLQPTQTTGHGHFNDADNSSEEANAFPDEAYLKRLYIRQMWQPRMNAILDSHGFNQLDEELIGWPDIRGVLQDIGFDESIRNQLLREFKQGFEAWQRSTTQRQPAHPSISHFQAQQPAFHAAQQAAYLEPASQPDQKNEMQTTRKGFSFWYTLDTSEIERGEIDDMIMDYHQWVLAQQTNRFGYYVVFVDPRDQTRQVAHGIWNLRKNQRPEDAAWFYKNERIPYLFRSGQPHLWHEWGYSIAPLSSKSRSKLPSKRTQESIRDADQESGTARGRVGKPKHSKPNNHKRRHIIDDDDDDDDYFPGAL